MDRRIQWTELAADDLKAIHDYIARDSERFAAGVTNRIVSAARSLSTVSYRGRMVPEFKSPDVRELIVGKYRLVYRISPRLITVLAIIHGARDLLGVWEDEGRPDPTA